MGTSRAEQQAVAPRGPILRYGLLAMPLAFAALPIYVHVPRLYGELQGLSLALVGVTLLLARLLDAVVDPLIGFVGDRVASRRRLIGFALPVLGIGFYALLNPPQHLSTLALLIWLGASLLVTTTAFSVATIVHQAWAAEIGQDSLWRTRLVASREGFAIVGVILAALLPSVLSSDFADGLARLSLLLIPVLALSAWLTLTSNRQQESAQETGIDKQETAGRVTGGFRGDSEKAVVSFRSQFFVVFADRTFRRLLMVFVCNGIAAALPSTLVLFYVSDVLAAEHLGGAFLGVYFLSGVLGLPFWLALAKRIGRARAWLISMTLAASAFLIAPFLGAGDVAIFMLVCLLSGLAFGADLALPGAILADCAEAKTRQSGQMSNGAYMGWWNLTAKLNLALAAGIALPLLQFLGYQPGSGVGVGVLAFAYGGLPIIFKLFAFALLWHWRNSLEISR